MDLRAKTILVTGGSGFLGTHLCNQLRVMGCAIAELKPNFERGPGVLIPRSKDFDLSRERDVERIFSLVRPDIIIHLAAVVGGIGINQLKPGTFYYKNLVMGALLMEHAHRHGVEKLVAIGTVCSYPCNTPVPFKEENLWDGFPEITNSGYGIAKKALLVQGQTYREEYGFNAIHLLPVNLYGPLDNFNPDTSHVIPALIKKCLDAKERGLDHIVCWGTGKASREFLYVKDAAAGIIMATQDYDSPEPVNLGSGQEISIKELVRLIAKLTEFTGKIVWDREKPNGQPRRCLDTSRARQFGFVAQTSFVEGLAETIRWYSETLRANHPT